MNKMDKKLISEKVLDKDGRVVLQRVINAGGVPYSAIVVDGFEELSTQTPDEEKMLNYFKENMLWLWDIELREDTE